VVTTATREHGEPKIMRSLWNFLATRMANAVDDTTARRENGYKRTAYAWTALFAGLLLALPAAAKSQKPADEPAPPKPVPVQSVNAAPLLPAGATTTEGTPVAVTGDTLLIGDKTVRLYGIAAPDIRVNHGADARVALDALIALRRVQCTELDR